MKPCDNMARGPKSFGGRGRVFGAAKGEDRSNKRRKPLPPLPLLPPPLSERAATCATHLQQFLPAFLPPSFTTAQPSFEWWRGIFSPPFPLPPPPMQSLSRSTYAHKKRTQVEFYLGKSGACVGWCYPQPTAAFPPFSVCVCVFLCGGLTRVLLRRLVELLRAVYVVSHRDCRRSTFQDDDLQEGDFQVLSGESV